MVDSSKKSEILKSDLIAVLLIFFVAILGLWQLSFLKYPMKWDIIDQALPWKYFIGESLKSHILPLWNPYQHCGYPIHADPQSSAWYPITWFWSYFFDYNIYILSLDVVLHIFLAGIGMYRLGRALKFCRVVAVIVGISYMFSGFFVSNAQHFMWLIAGTWLPFVISQYILMAEKPTIKKAVVFSLFMFLLLTGGYPAFTMILFYFLMILFIWYFYEKFKRSGQKEALKFVRINFTAVILSILTSLVMLVSVWKLMPYMNRTEGVTLTQALFGPFSIKTLISFILPFGVVSKDFSWSGTDISMANGYFGIFMFALLIASFFIKKTPVIKIFFYWAIFMLTAAVGDALPVREFLYYNVPFFNLFRFPAMLRIFTIIGFIVTAGYTLDYFLTNKKIELVRKYLYVPLVLIVFYVLYKIHQTGLLIDGYFKALALFHISKWNYITEHILFQGIIQILIIGALFFIITKLKNTKKLSALLIFIVIFDMTFALQLNAPYTIIDRRVTQKFIFEHTRNYPKGFPLPDARPIINNGDKQLHDMKWFWKNLAIFHKKISWDGYNPLHLKNFMLLEDSLHGILIESLKNNAFFYAEKIIPFDSIRRDEKKGNYNNRKIYLKNNDLQNLNFKDHKMCNTNPEIVFFSPNKASVKTECNYPIVLVYLQNNYYGWKVYIDGKSSTVLKANGTFNSVEVPNGKHIVTFIFEPIVVIYTFYISIITIIFMLVYLLITYFKRKSI